MNIYDISRLAGVSIATVSRVLNGSDKVSDATRQKVLDIMEQNGYTPNAFARGLGLNTMRTVGDPMRGFLRYLSGKGHLSAGTGALEAGLCLHAVSAPATGWRKRKNISSFSSPAAWTR